MTWWRHPAIDAALRRLPALADEGAVDISVLANEVGLSISRLTHVFTEEVGMPIRSYVRWMRLVNAMEHLCVGGTLTAAAHTGGFADATHFSRTFKAMFGVGPSELVSLGKRMAS
jgi:AraC-like DNA-binding protein